MFDDFSKTILDGRKRWDKIEKLTDEINDLGCSQDTKVIVELVTLLVEHLRPMSPSQEQIEAVTKGLDGLLSTLKK